VITWLKDKFGKAPVNSPPPILTEGKTKTNVKPNRPTPKPQAPKPQAPKGEKSAKKSSKKKAKKVAGKKSSRKTAGSQMEKHLKRKLKGKPQLLLGTYRDSRGELMAELSKPYAEMTAEERQLVGIQAVSLLLTQAGQKRHT